MYDYVTIVNSNGIDILKPFIRDLSVYEYVYTYSHVEGAFDQNQTPNTTPRTYTSTCTVPVHKLLTNSTSKISLFLNLFSL